MDILIIILQVLVLIVLGIVILLLRKKGQIGTGNTIDMDEFIEVEKGLIESIREDIERSKKETIERGKDINTMSSKMLSKSIKDLSDSETNNSHNLKIEINNQITAINTSMQNTLKEIKESNIAELNKIRQIVDKELADALDKKVSKAYEAVQLALDSFAKKFVEVQKLASSVGDLNKVFSNVKTLGGWGEIMLENILKQILSTPQYKMQFDLDGKGKKVDFAIVLPGKEDNEQIYLPIDCKFYKENYQKILDFPDEYAVHYKSLLDDIKKQAKSISSKYIIPNITTDFAIMYLPTEGLFAEVAKNEAALSELERLRIVIAGPTTITALLNSLQMGFKTLAIEKHSYEIRELLFAFKKDFSNFVTSLASAKKQANTVSGTLDLALKRSEKISRKLEKVEQLSNIKPNTINDNLQEVIENAIDNEKSS